MIKLQDRHTNIPRDRVAGVRPLPLYRLGFWIRLLTSIFLYAILAQGLNIIAGFTGYAAFGI